MVVSSVLLGGYFLLRSLVGPDSHAGTLNSESRELSKKVEELASLYRKLNNDMDSLNRTNNELRLASDLPPVNDIDKNPGTGGGMFDNIVSLSHQSKIDLEALSEYIENVKNKINFEKNNFAEISQKLKNNQQLYSSIPAIKPSYGTLANHGFGMRVHPILGINRMHEGVDIITDIGTPVMSPGKGVISFTGSKGGYGLCIEIDHSFGYRTVLGHLSQINVNVGQQVERGEVIAKSGNSGLSSGPHLHYEVHHNGVAMDPEGFIFDDLGLFEITAKK